MEFIKGLFSKKMYHSKDDIATKSDHEIYDLVKNTDQISSDILSTGTTDIHTFQHNAMSDVLEIKKKLKSGEIDEGKINEIIYTLKYGEDGDMEHDMNPMTVARYTEEKMRRDIKDVSKRFENSKREAERAAERLETDRKNASLNRDREQSNILLNSENKFRKTTGQLPIEPLHRLTTRGFGKRTRRNIHKGKGKSKRTKHHKQIKRKNHKKSVRRA
jgi:hypothetical protein